MDNDSYILHFIKTINNDINGKIFKIFLKINHKNIPQEQNVYLLYQNAYTLKVLKV